MQNWFKRLIPLMMIMCLLCGCDATVEPEISNNNVQVEVSADAVKDNADTNKKTEQESTSQVPKRPREDLDVEVAPGIYSIYGLMRVHFIDVGQADSAFIELGNGQTMLIDAGLSGYDVVSYIRELQYETIDYVVASHPHDDHIGGMATVLDSFNIGKMYMPKQAHTITAFTDMLDVIERKGIELYTAKSWLRWLRKKAEKHLNELNGDKSDKWKKVLYSDEICLDMML